MKNFNKEWLRLYAVTDRAWLGDETLYEQVEKALRGGATMVQIREKELDEAHSPGAAPPGRAPGAMGGLAFPDASGGGDRGAVHPRQMPQ